MTVFSILFVLLLLSVFIIDLVPMLDTWQRRIHIGKFSDDVLWHQKVASKSLVWLNHMPVTKVKDNQHLILIDILKKQYSSTTIQSWQEASLLAGIYSHYQRTQGLEARQEILKFLSRKIDKNGRWIVPPTEVDACWLGFVLMHIEFIDSAEIRPALDALYHIILDRIGADGLVMYRKSMPQYRYVDTIGFISPFLVKYGLDFGVPDAVSLGISQIKTFEKFGTLGNKIPCHAYEVSSHHPIGIFGWGRGIAWFLIGILEVYKHLPTEHEERAYLRNHLEELAGTLKTYQQDNGGFSWNILVERERIDSSATAVFALLFLELGMDEAYQKAKGYLKSVTRRDGAVDFSQGDTKGLGNYSQHFDVLPFTQGFVLRCLEQFQRDVI